MDKPNLYHCEELDKCSCLSQDLKSKINNYLQWDPRVSTRKEVLQLLKNCEENKVLLSKLFLKRLEFGTAGLRGPMGPGFNCMNDLTVMQASQGLCTYLIKAFGPSECSARGVVLGFDGRHNSERYAHVASAVFLSKGFKVYLNSKVTATPMNPYAIVKFHCVAGAQVTASHNPKNDNGFKVYGDNAAQIISPMDVAVTELIFQNLVPWDDALALLDSTTGLLKDLTKVIDPYQTLFNAYMEEIPKDLCMKKGETAATNLKIVYTPMHGVGFPFVQEILKQFGFPEKQLYVVEEQKLPDPDFSTVVFPNPEEKGALDRSIALADSVGSPLVIANDPDADRFACVEKQPDGKWKVFHGDELGILFSVEAFDRYLKLGVPPNKMLFICSAVSSRMLQKFAETEGCRFEETMTGFKWMMNTAIDIQKSESCVPCLIYEEALGYALHKSVPDKDGISAAAVWVQMVCELYKKGLTVAEHLDQLRKKYGYFVTNNSYFLCYDKHAIVQLFDEFRNEGKYKPSLGSYKIIRVRDVTVGYDSGQPNEKCAFPLTPNSQMITLYFDNGAVLTLRTSGTEPKLKWYAEMSGSDPLATKAELQKVVDATVQHLMQPAKYPLETPKVN